jgi:hypothetical protein
MPTIESGSPVDMYTITGTQAAETTTDAVAVDPFSTVTIANPANPIGTATVMIQGATYNGAVSNLGSGTLSADGSTYTVTGTPAQIQAALQGLVFTPVANEVPVGQSVQSTLSLFVGDAAATVQGGQTVITATAAATPGGPVIYDPFAPGRFPGLFLNDQQTAPLFAAQSVSLSDSNAEALDTVTITLTQNTALTDVAGSLSGAGLTKIGVGTYQLAAGTPAAVLAELEAIMFTPAAVTTDAQSVVHVGLQVSDGVSSPISKTGPTIEVFDQGLVLSAAGASAATNPGGEEVVTDSQTNETDTVDTPVDAPSKTYATTISATLNGGQTVFSQTFALPYSDPAVQAAVAQADAVLAGDNAVAAAPTLAASQVTNVGTQTAITQTGSSDLVTTSTSDTFGPAILGPGLQFANNGGPLSYFQVLAGQLDINVNTDNQYTIDQTVTTTGTVLTTQSYVIAGTSTISGGNGTLPDVSASFTSAVYATLLSTLTGLIPSGAAPHVVSISGGASAGAAVSGTLNAYVDTLAAAGATDTITAGYTAGYLLGGTGTLRDTGGSAILIDATAGASLTGTANDTLFGGDAGATLFATTGAETLIGGTGANAFFLGASAAQVMSQGNDIITGSSAAETVTASGSLLYFGTSGATNLTMSGTGSDTIIGGNNGNTVQGGGGAQLIFGSSSLDYTGGAGAATIIGGGGGNTVTGGAGNLLLFASSSMTYTGTGAAATVIGGGGPLTAALGSGGGVAYGGTGGGDTLSTSSASQSVLVGGGNGDVLTATGSGNDYLVAGYGSTTLNGAGGTGNLVFYGGAGPDAIIGGAGTNLFVAEPGSETLTGGGTANNTIMISFGPTTRTDVFTNFDPAHDAIGLYGYGTQQDADAAALASATASGGTTTVSLSDGTTLVFLGAPTLNSYNFF